MTDSQEILNILYKFILKIKNENKANNEYYEKILREIEEIREDVKEYNYKINTKLGEIISTAVGLAKSSEDTLGLVQNRIQEIGGISDLTKKSESNLWSVGQELLNSRFTVLISDELPISISRARQIIENWMIDSYGSGMAVTGWVDRDDREKVGDSFINFLRSDYHISDRLTIILKAYFDAFYLLVTHKNRDKPRPLFEDIRESVQKRRDENEERVKNPPSP